MFVWEDFVSSINFIVASKSGNPPRIALYPLNVSWSGGVNFNEEAAITARKGITFDISVIPEENIIGKVPTTNIKVIPKGSIKARGISGSASPLQIMGMALLPTTLYLLLKYLSEFVNFTSTIDFIDLNSDGIKDTNEQSQSILMTLSSEGGQISLTDQN